MNGFVPVHIDFVHELQLLLLDFPETVSLFIQQLCPDLKLSTFLLPTEDFVIFRQVLSRQVDFLQFLSQLTQHLHVFVPAVVDVMETHFLNVTLQFLQASSQRYQHRLGCDETHGLCTLDIAIESFVQQKGLVTEEEHFGEAVVAVEKVNEGEVGGEDGVGFPTANMEANIHGSPFRFD